MPWAVILQFVLKHWKWFAYAGVALLVLYSIRLYGNAQWREGLDEGNKAAQVEYEKAYRIKWEAAQKQIDGQRRLLDEAAKANEDNRKVLDARGAEIARARQALIAAMDRATEVAKIGISSGYESAGTIPDSELVGTIRALSVRLERERTAASPPPE